jgi:hypothetical protein
MDGGLERRYTILVYNSFPGSGEHMHGRGGGEIDCDFVHHLMHGRGGVYNGAVES